MIRFFLIALLTAGMALSGCGAEIEQEPVKVLCDSGLQKARVDEQVSKYVLEFYEELQKREKKVCYLVTSIRIVPNQLIFDETKRAAGLCYSQTRSYIEISGPSWEIFDEWQRRALVFHELGHCVLGLDHSPRSAINIMAPVVLPSAIAKAHWPALVDKLFNKDMTGILAGELELLDLEDLEW